MILQKVNFAGQMAKGRMSEVWGCTVWEKAHGFLIHLSQLMLCGASYDGWFCQWLKNGRRKCCLLYVKCCMPWKHSSVHAATGNEWICQQKDKSYSGNENQSRGEIKSCRWLPIQIKKNLEEQETGVHEHKRKRAEYTNPLCHPYRCYIKSSS